MFTGSLRGGTILKDVKGLYIVSEDGTLKEYIHDLFQKYHGKKISVKIEVIE